MKILLHTPLHPSYWVYLMETMPEHEWYIEPNEYFEEGGTPRNHIKYTVVPRKTNIKYDVQVICLSSHHTHFNNLIRDFHVPIVFLDFWKVELPNLKIKYPLLSCCHHISNSNYPNIRYTYVPPSKTLWNKPWIGDIKKVFIPSQRYLEPRFAHKYFSILIRKLQKTDLNLDIIGAVKEGKRRPLPWKLWQSYFIHDRVLLDCADKRASFVIEEAMTIGMPVVSRSMYESPWLIKDRVGGFLEWTQEELVELLHKFTEDYTFATKWSIKSRERGKIMLSSEKTRQIWNKAFSDAIKLFNSTKTPFMKTSPEKKKSWKRELVFVSPKV